VECWQVKSLLSQAQAAELGAVLQWRWPRLAQKSWSTTLGPPYQAKALVQVQAPRKKSPI
jgi:hypothetical protein